MKLLFPTLALLVSLTSCSDDAPEPAPALTGGPWTLQTETVQATPANGDPSYTVPVSTDEKVTLHYTDATHYSLDLKASGGSGRHFESTYSVQGQTLLHAAFYNWHTRSVVPLTVQVAELTAHKVVLAEKWEYFEPWDKSLTYYVTTYTFSR